MRLSPIAAVSALLCAAAAPVCGTVFTLSAQTGLIAPSSRGGANTTYYGWDTFHELGGAVPINDATPDMGSAVAGARFRTTNGEVHVLGSGNFYLFAGSPAEEVTAVTSGLAGTGFTSVILQGVTIFDNFPGLWNFGTVNGVTPSVVQGVNATGAGQFWVKYDFPGNAANYVIPFTAGGPHYSIDKFTVDTSWSAGGFQADAVLVPEPGALTLALGSLAGMLTLRRRRC